MIKKLLIVEVLATFRTRRKRSILYLSILITIVGFIYTSWYLSSDSANKTIFKIYWLFALIAGMGSYGFCEGLSSTSLTLPFINSLFTKKISLNDWLIAKVLIQQAYCILTFIFFLLGYPLFDHLTQKIIFSLFIYYLGINSFVAIFLSLTIIVKVDYNMLGGEAKPTIRQFLVIPPFVALYFFENLYDYGFWSLVIAGMLGLLLQKKMAIILGKYAKTQKHHMAKVAYSS